MNSITVARSDRHLPIMPDEGAQYLFEQINVSNRLSGEMKLLYAVLEDAVYLVIGGPKKGKQRDYNEAITWFTTIDFGTGITSYRTVCESLGLDPSYFRKHLFRKIKQDSSRVAKEGV